MSTHRRNLVISTRRLRILQSDWLQQISAGWPAIVVRWASLIYSRQTALKLGYSKLHPQQWKCSSKAAMSSWGGPKSAGNGYALLYSRLVLPCLLEKHGVDDLR